MHPLEPDVAESIMPAQQFLLGLQQVEVGVMTRRDGGRVGLTGDCVRSSDSVWGDGGAIIMVADRRDLHLRRRHSDPVGRS